MTEMRRRMEGELELRAGERPLGFADHEGVPAAGWVGSVYQEAARLRTS